MKLFKKIKSLLKKEETKVEEKTIGESITSYIKDVQWDDLEGELVINHSVHLPYAKQIWFGDPDGKDAPDLGHCFSIDADESVKYFTEKIKESSKTTFPKLEEVNGEMPTEEMYSGYVQHLKMDVISYASTCDNLKILNQDLYYKNLYENAEKTLFQMKKIKRANEKVVEKIMRHEETRIKSQPAFKSTIHGK